MAGAAPHQLVEELTAALDRHGVQLMPIRHHSPACAWHVRRWIREHRPCAVLIEGPRDFTPQIPDLLHAETRTPVALYTTFVDRRRRLKLEGATATDPARFAGFFPFCDHSPELVALREGDAVGAELRFIDLTFPEQVLAEAATFTGPDLVRTVSLLNESHLRHSEYVNALARRRGCRDPDELWDHLFEVRYANLDTREFCQQVATYCLMARQDYTPRALDADGTRAREAAMARTIRQVRAEVTGPILVVTGGFHTAALPLLLGEEPEEEPTPLELDQGEAANVIMRYSFDQLDALSGYASGMRSPRYYDLLWRLMCDTGEDPFLTCASHLLIEIGHLGRQHKFPSFISPADEIAALSQARLLARLRGHSGPSREDLLDAVRACYVKGSMDAEGALVMAVVEEALRGTAVGVAPPTAATPPIVTDFMRAALALSLPVEDTGRKQVSLDIYRKARHRRISKLLHRLTYLQVPYARILGGPDFASGRDLHLLNERWEIGWSPTVDAALIEQSVRGESVREASATLLAEAIAGLEERGRGRSTREAVSLLMQAFQMGLKGELGRVLDLVEANIAADPQFVSLVMGAEQLVLLWRSKEPLEAHETPEIPRLATTACQKACYLVGNLEQIAEAETDSVLTALASLREIWVAQEGWLDQELFTEALGVLNQRLPGNATVIGAAAGSLFSLGVLKEEALLNQTVGFLVAAAANPRRQTGFLRGVLHASRESLWRTPGMLERLDQVIAHWDKETFLKVLPQLRLAFSYLTPRETDRVSCLVAALYGEQDLGPLVRHDLTEDELHQNLTLSEQVGQVLCRDGLAAWCGTDPEVDGRG